MPEPDDITLLGQYVGGDESAFTKLFERHVHLVYSAALRQARNPSHAEEVTQAVFILLARKAKSLSPKIVLSGWLYQAARLTTASLIKREIRRQRREQEVYMQTSTEPDTLLWEQISPLLDDAMGRLGETDRNAIVLRFFENRTSREVAVALKLNEVTARKRVSRALEKLRTFFAKRGVVLTAAIIAGAISGNSVQAAPTALANSAMAIAISKGAIAGGSTLSLINGAMKIMAWTKAKTTVVAAVAVVAAGGLGFTTVSVVHRIRVAHYPDLRGAWEGTVLLDDAGVESGAAASSRVIFKFKRSLGVYTATTDWIDSGRKDIPMLKVDYDYPSLTIQATSRDTWSLKVNEDGTQILWGHKRNFIQSDPVIFKHTTTPDPVPKRLAEEDFAPRAGSDLQGYWKGAISIGTDAMPVDLKIAEDAAGTLRAEADSPMQGSAGMPVTVSYNRPNVTITAATGGGRFDGTINDAKAEIVGRFTQNGQSIPATIRRADYEAEHEHDAERNYSFLSPLDLQGHWRGTWMAKFPNVTVPIRLQLDIAKLPDGSYSAGLTDLDNFLVGAPIPASGFDYSSPNLKLKWNMAGKAYQAELKDGKLIGTWHEGGGGFPLVMKRTALN